MTLFILWYSTRYVCWRAWTSPVLPLPGTPTLSPWTLPQEQVRTFARGNLGYLKVGLAGLRRKLSYVAAVEVYLLAAQGADMGAWVGAGTKAGVGAGAGAGAGAEVGAGVGVTDDGRRGPVLADLAALATLLDAPTPTAPVPTALAPASAPGEAPAPLDTRLRALLRSVGGAILLAQPLVLTLSAERLQVSPSACLAPV